MDPKDTNMTGALRRDLDTDRHRERPREDREKTATYELRREASEEAT